MKTETAKWELNIILQSKSELSKIGRDIDYNEQNRIRELRDFLDKQVDETKEQTEVKTE